MPGAIDYTFLQLLTTAPHAPSHPLEAHARALPGPVWQKSGPRAVTAAGDFLFLAAYSGAMKQTQESPPTHLSRLDQSLAQLLHTQRVLALGTLDAQGEPFVSMAPYAIEPDSASLVLCVSALAAHTGHLQQHPQASAMVQQPPSPEGEVHALERASLQVHAHFPEPGSATEQSARAAYLRRFAQAQMLLQLPDFRIVTLQCLQARHVAGFGAARSVAAQALLLLLRNDILV